MQIDEELLEQWEPKIHSMLRSYTVPSYDDAVQELRMTIVKCAKGWKPEKASFHTYLHMAMKNALIQIRRRQKKILDNVAIEQSLTPIWDINHRWNDVYDGVIIWDIYRCISLTRNESIVLDMILCGYSLRDLYKIVVDRQSVKSCLRRLRRKLTLLRKERCF